MAKLSDEELQRIVEEQMPGFTLARRVTAADAAPRAKPDAVSPDLASLKRKYPGAAADDTEAAAAGDEIEDAADYYEAPGEEDADADADEDAIVVVEPTAPRDPLDPGAGPKTVVVSGAEKRIIGYQG
jgi:hypothetical protein